MDLINPPSLSSICPFTYFLGYLTKFKNYFVPCFFLQNYEGNSLVVTSARQICPRTSSPHSSSELRNIWMLKFCPPFPQWISFSSTMFPSPYPNIHGGLFFVLVHVGVDVYFLYQHRRLFLFQIMNVATMLIDSYILLLPYVFCYFGSLCLSSSGASREGARGPWHPQRRRKKEFNVTATDVFKELCKKKRKLYFTL